jgi:hypothetical protein
MGDSKPGRLFNKAPKSNREKEKKNKIYSGKVSTSGKSSHRGVFKSQHLFYLYWARIMWQAQCMFIILKISTMKIVRIKIVTYVKPWHGATRPWWGSLHAYLPGNRNCNKGLPKQKPGTKASGMLHTHKKKHFHEDAYLAAMCSGLDWWHSVIDPCG